MKKAVYRGIRDMEVVEGPVPQIGPYEVLLQVKYCSICGTDIRIYHYGHFKIPPGTERVLGHEVVGVIASVGSEVRGLAPGMRVAVAPNIGCGQCEVCLRGWNQLCPDYQAFGISLDGGFQEYMKITAPAVLRGNIVGIPDGVSFEEAVLVEPLSCVYNGVEAVDIRAADVVVIIGAGPIGLLHVQMAKLKGAAKVILSETVEERLQDGARFGADVLVNPSKEDLKSVIFKETGGKGADVVITACSVPAVQQRALELAGVFGRINLFGGLPRGQETVPLNTNLIHYKQLKVTATTGSNYHQFRRSMELIAAGRVEVKSLIEGIYRLESIKDAFERVAGKASNRKVVIGFDW
ncbi:zinc-dependent dehydrogenase [Thermanaeromonas sp. C210]|uniref:zinc-dependent dehydrogenase n=1 Tax=Thermanaeromonas sp. C210 TaxID=2731925 RepID=UPI00155C0482|nr:zinc-dependent dehydrogenase [Thermanaeromonas sp. C210]GFN22577.1 alcohol dehydrogenase [Thermanaeromonas sp. C210]